MTRPEDIDFEDLSRLGDKLSIDNRSIAERRAEDVKPMMDAERRRMDRGDRTLQTNLKFAQGRKKAMLADAARFKGGNLTLLCEVAHDLFREVLNQDGGHDRLRKMFDERTK